MQQQQETKFHEQFTFAASGRIPSAVGKGIFARRSLGPTSLLVRTFVLERDVWDDVSCKCVEAIQAGPVDPTLFVKKKVGWYGRGLYVSNDTGM